MPIYININYTGNILIGIGNVNCNFDRECYEENCLMSLHSFSEVVRSKFKNGEIISIKDIGEDMNL